MGTTEAGRDGEGSPVRIVGLSRRFGSVEAVKGVSLEIREGETFGMLGPNGAGKTTTLSMLSTLLEPTAGDASIFGHSLTREVRSVRRVVGLAPQQISLYPDLSGEENLHFFGRVHGVARDAVRSRAKQLLELVGLTPRKDDRVRIYSGGMQRRLNLACSVIHQPRLLLLDEPTAGVDPQSRDKLFAVVRALAEQGTTVLYTTHYMEEAERLCDRIAILDEGQVVAAGTLEELLEIVGVGEVIELRGSLSEAHASRFGELATVRRVETKPELTRVYVDNAARALAPIGALLSELGGAVEALQVYPVNLERVFMHLTGHELRD